MILSFLQAPWDPLLGRKRILANLKTIQATERRLSPKSRKRKKRQLVPASREQRTMLGAPPTLLARRMAQIKVHHPANDMQILQAKPPRHPPQLQAEPGLQSEQVASLSLLHPDKTRLHRSRPVPDHRRSIWGRLPKTCLLQDLHETLHQPLTRARRMNSRSGQSLNFALI